MAIFAANGILIPTNVSTTASSRQKYTSYTSSNQLRINSLSPSFPSISLSCTTSPSRQRDISLKDNLVHSLANSLFFASASSSASLGLGGGRGGGRGGGGGGLGGGKGGGGGGRGGGGGFWKSFFSLGVPMAEASEEGSSAWDSHGLPANIVVQMNRLSGFKRYKVSEILFFDKRTQTTVDTEDSFFDMVSIKPGDVYTKSQLQKELGTLVSCGMFDKVDLEGKTKPDGTLGVTVSFSEATWKAADKFRCASVGLLKPQEPVKTDPDMTEKEMLEHYRSQEREYKRKLEKSRPCLLPGPIQREMTDMLREHSKLNGRVLQKVGERVVKWYHDQGYAYANVVNFGNLNTKEVVCEVVEGDITRLVVQFQDKLGNVVEGNTQIPVVHRQIPKQLRPGYVYNMGVANQAIRNIHGLGLFSNIVVTPRPDEKVEGGVVVEVSLNEADKKSADVDTEWSIVRGNRGFPTLASCQPGGTVSFEHRNIKGLNRSIMGSVTTNNLLNPKDLSFKLDYVHPYLDGVFNPRNRTFRTSVFNTSKLSPVFTGGPGFEDSVPSVAIDRFGLKANITENYTPQSKFTYGLVMEEITTRDENNKISTNGLRLLPTGGYDVKGPPTTLSGTGIDRKAFLQANITRDNTKFVNGAIVGQRNIFQVDQGLGIGSKFPLFNRHQLSLTKFIQLKRVEEGPGKPQPPVLVLHGRYGGCVGDLPSYDAFVLGGPHSVRGYTMGELGAARNILEAGAEIRVPVKNTYVYAFGEHGNDLGSSKDVKGNPTAVYGRRGHGSSYGVGVKLGKVRAEYAIDHNTGKGAFYLRFGERY